MKASLDIYNLRLGASIVVGARASSSGKWIAFAAGVIFYVSDIFVANWKYVITAGWNANVCYPLYYLACNLFALSIWKTVES